MMVHGDLRKMLNPETIALIGATDRPGAVGRVLLENLYYWSRERKIFPINPNRRTVLGFPCYPSVRSVAERLDLVVIATPAPTVPEVVEECGQAEANGILIISAGFREVGVEGKNLEERIEGLKDQYGMRIIGPNCQGVIRPHIALNASLLTAAPRKGNVAFLSQTGALGGAIFDWAALAHAGFSIYASLGSMIDVDFSELIDFLGVDPHTRSIVVYMEEGVGNAKKFMSAVKGFASSKPIIVLKPGRWVGASKTALSRTAGTISSDQVYDAALKRVSVVRVKEVADLFNTVRVLHSKHLPKGPRLAIVTNTSGVGIMAVDAVLTSGGTLATMSEESLQRLQEIVPTYCHKNNPIDVYRDADVDRYICAIQVCLEDSGVDGLLVIYTLQEQPHPKTLANAITEVGRTSWKPIITTWIGGREVQEGRKILFQNSIPTYETPEEAVRAYMCMHDYKRSLELQYETPAELSLDQSPPRNNLKAFIRRSVKEGKLILNEEESNRFLVTYGVPVRDVRIAKDKDEAIYAARVLGFPLVLKIVSPDILYPTDVGGILFGIHSEEELKEEYDRLIQQVGEKAPQARISGVAIQKVIDKIDYEIFLGAQKDKDFGAVIVFGMGGMGLRLFKDFSIGLPPLNQALARRLMEETKAFQMLQGYGRRPPADLRQLEQLIVSFSNLIVDFPEIGEMDIPSVVISEGRIYALDARIVIDPTSLEHRSSYPHLVMTPYPTRYVTRWSLTEGQEIMLRPIKPEDEPLLGEMLRSLSEEALQERFFQRIKSITHEMLIRLCHIDYDRQIRIVAEIKEETVKKLIGFGGLMIESDFKKGEFAVMVHDQYQGKGLGYKLIDVLIGVAQEKGLEEFYGFVMSNNRRMLHLCRKLGLTVTFLPEGMARVKLALK
jgi:acetyltransferase